MPNIDYMCNVTKQKLDEMDPTLDPTTKTKQIETNKQRNKTVCHV